MAHSLARAKNMHFVVQQHGRNLIGHVIGVRLGVVRHVAVSVHETVHDGLGGVVIAGGGAIAHFFLLRGNPFFCARKEFFFSKKVSIQN
jgi:hypothetical protein